MSNIVSLSEGIPKKHSGKLCESFSGLKMNRDVCLNCCCSFFRSSVIPFLYPLIFISAFKLCSMTCHRQPATWHWGYELRPRIDHVRNNPAQEQRRNITINLSFSSLFLLSFLFYYFLNRTYPCLFRIF